MPAKAKRARPQKVIYIRSHGGRLWHVQRRITPGGCVDMLCGMMATGRFPGAQPGAFDRTHRTWPKPRCLACEARYYHTPIARYRKTVTVAFPNGHGETLVMVTVGGKPAVVGSVKAMANAVKVYLPQPHSTATTPGDTVMLRYAVSP